MKYIGTKVDGKSCILSMTICNLCPFFNLDHKDKKSYCTNPKLENSKKFISSVYSYLYKDGYYYPLVDIIIPDWCNLDDISTNILTNKQITFLRHGDIQYDTLDIVSDINIISHHDVKYDGCKLVPNTQIKKYEYQYNSNITLTKYCSFCGQDKSDVDRTINFGICSECWNKLSTDKNNDDIYFAYINNFRLKRKSTFTNLKFKKIINNIKI